MKYLRFLPNMIVWAFLCWAAYLVRVYDRTEALNYLMFFLSVGIPIQLLACLAWTNRTFKGRKVGEPSRKPSIVLQLINGAMRLYVLMIMVAQGYFWLAAATLTIFLLAIITADAQRQAWIAEKEQPQAQS